MSAAPQDPVRGLVDPGGRLVAADPPLLRLHLRAGGRAGGPLAVPPLAHAARLARRLGIAISRGVVVADEANDLDLWVRAAPRPDGVHLAIVGWHARQPAPPPDAERDFLRAEHDWWWRSDAALTLTGLSPAAPGAALVGAPLATLLAFEADAEGRLPIVEATAEARAFEAQLATLRHGAGGRVRLAGRPIHDAAGGFAGYFGTARRLSDPAHEPPPPPGDAFGERLGRALKAPLDRIIAAADAIGARGEGPLRHDYASYAADIASAGRHLLALIDDLVDLSAIERPDYAPEREPIDLADLARRAAGLLTLRARERGVALDLPKPGETLAAAGEYRRVLQILVNLIGNAVRYSPPGAAVWLRGEAADGVARLVIADQGKGIAAEDQARIFGKFERVDAAEPGGTGLGLYIARRLARAMGGDVAVESAPGEGARFTLSLPSL